MSGPKKEKAVEESRQHRNHHQPAEVLPDRAQDDDKKINEIKIGLYLAADNQRCGDKDRVKNYQRRIKVGGIEERILHPVKRNIAQDVDEDKGVNRCGGEPRPLGCDQQIGTNDNYQPSQPEDRYLFRDFKDSRCPWNVYWRIRCHLPLSTDHHPSRSGEVICSSPTIRALKFLQCIISPFLCKVASLHGKKGRAVGPHPVKNNQSFPTSRILW